MIISYRNKETSDFAAGKRVKRFSGFQDQGWKRLRILNAAPSLQDLGRLPSNHLEALSGDRNGQCSIRINEQWRICFEWALGDPGPSLVEIVDYH